MFHCVSLCFTSWKTTLLVNLKGTSESPTNLFKGALPLTWMRRSWGLLSSGSPVRCKSKDTKKKILLRGSSQKRLVYGWNFCACFFFCRMFFFVCFIFFPSLSDLQIKYESFWVCKTQVIALMNKPSAWYFTQMFNSPNQVTSLQIRVVTDDRESTKRWDLPIVGFSIWISSFVGFDQMKLRTTMTILVLDWTSLSITMNIMNTANLVNDPLGHMDLLCSTTSSKTFCSVSELPWTFIIPPCRWHWTKTNLLF